MFIFSINLFKITLSIFIDIGLGKDPTITSPYEGAIASIHGRVPMTNKTKSWSLQNGYEIRLVEYVDIENELQAAIKIVFGDDGAIFFTPSDDEKARTKSLSQHMGSPLRLYFGLFHNNQFCGWHFGDQTNSHDFYMRNSGILPSHRRKGLYTNLLQCVMKHVLDLGFQTISSKHNATNNAVIIQKLREGFIITGLELSDRFGTLVRLEYFSNAERRHLLDYRSGMAGYDERISVMKKGR